MATEDDALKSLQNIEKLLRSATALSGNKPNFSGRTQQSQKERADREVRKAFKAVAASAGDLKDSFLGLTKGLVGLNNEVGTTTKSFGALNTQMAKFMSSLQPIAAPDGEPLPLVDNKELIKAIGLWGGETVKAINNLGNLIKQQPVQQAAPTSSFFGLFRRQQAGAPAPMTPTPATPTPSTTPVASVIQRLVQNFGMAAAASGGLTYTFGKLIDAATQVTADFFELSRLGMGSIGYLKDLYIYAAKAGMSLEEYNAMLKSSITVASKAGTLENFNRIISAQDDVLASMGIFGKEARQFQANLAQSAASAGISIDDLTDATGAQIRMFDRLLKTTSLTADEFADMVSSVAKNTSAQRELVGLAPRQRVARMQELVQLQTIGTQFGMTAKASEELGNALIQMRQSTVKERIDQGAALLQLGAFTGNGAAAQRAYELNLKGRGKTKDEEAELTGLVQKLSSGAQGMYESASQSGQVGTQAVLDNLLENVNKGSLGELIKQGDKATLAKDAGAQNQEAFGKHVGEFGQAVGKLTAWAEGFKKSVGAPIIAAVGAGLMAAFRGPIIGLLSKAAGLGVSGGASAASATGSMMTNLLTPLKSLQTGLGGLFTGLKGWVAGVKDSYNIGKTVFNSRAIGSLFGAVAGLWNAAAGLTRGFVTILSGVSNFVASMAPLAAVTSGIFEAFTGELSQAMDPNGGIWSRVNGVITAALTSVPQMIIDALTWVFGDSFMKPIQSIFDVIKTGVTGAINLFARGLLGGISYLTDLLPDDSALKKMVDSAKSSLDASIEANANTVKALGGFEGTDRKTLNELSKVQADNAKKVVDNTKVVTKTVQDSQAKFNNVMAANQLTSAGLIQDAKILAAQPQAQVQPAVQPVTVNKTEAQTPESTTPEAEKQTGNLSDNGEILNVLQALLQVMRDNLDAEKRQALNSDELLARLSRSTAGFQSPEEVANKLLKRG